jgi:hypothetical protein
MKKITKTLTTLFAIIGLVVTVFSVVKFGLRTQHRYVAFCLPNGEQPLKNCAVYEAETSYDSGDGQFWIEKVFGDLVPVLNFSNTCEVSPLGGICKRPDNRQDVMVIPLTGTVSLWRWQKPGSVVPHWF